MKVLLIGNYVYTHQKSMQRFADLLAELLVQAGHEVKLISPAPLLGRFHPSEYGLGKWLGYLDRFGFFIPRLLAAVSWPDIIHICDHSNAVYVRYLRSRPHVVTCHDLIAIGSAVEDRGEHRVRWSGRVYQRLVVQGLRQARRIVCVSGQTRSELARLVHVELADTAVVYNAQNHAYRPMAGDEAVARLKRLGLAHPVRYLLHVGGNQWYKNRIGVVRIFSRFAQERPGEGWYLVLAGKTWPPELARAVEVSGVSERIVCVTGADNEDLRALYSRAAALLFPSLEEGFGWPIIEAQACGCPVFTSNRLPMTEVGGDAAIYFDPRDVDESAAIIADGLPRAGELAAMGLENVKRFSREKMLQGYLDAYEAVLGEARGEAFGAR